ncbi:MAG TPA: LysR family transcriptional regulator [Solirubrobacterales bacterium]|nr:LysR family transcriptional regulator [Solirubrobacterales bacterium]
MELRQLRYAEAVARHRHFTRAAEELHVAQSALSHQIRRLEAELGAELFRRTSRRVEPTEAGDALAVRARRILAEVDGVRGDIDELEGLVRGHLWIGALLPAGELDVPALLARFREAYPEIEVSLREGTAGDMLGYLANGEVDAAFSLVATELPDHLAAERLGNEELVAAFPPGAAPRGEGVAASELARHVLVTPRSGSAIKRGTDEFFARAGRRLQVSLESGDPFLLRCLVSSGFGAAVLPRSLTEREGPPIEVRTLRPAVRLAVALLWDRDRSLSPAGRAFIDFVRRSA